MPSGLWVWVLAKEYNTHKEVGGYHMVYWLTIDGITNTSLIAIWLLTQLVRQQTCMCFREKVIEPTAYLPQHARQWLNDPVRATYSGWLTSWFGPLPFKMDGMWKLPARTQRFITWFFNVYKCLQVYIKHSIAVFNEHLFDVCSKGGSICSVLVSW